jgi:hypothetical protein
MTGRDVSLLCGVGQRELCRGVIRPQFGVPTRPCRCDCYDAEDAA